jgi:F0F1-type ATP synthase assembly protein I
MREKKHEARMAEADKRDLLHDDEGRESLPGTPSPSGRKNLKDFGNQSALAMELPFTLVGAVVFSGLLGYVLDRWLHTKPWLMFVFGALGFAAGVREVIRRLPAK